MNEDKNLYTQYTDCEVLYENPPHVVHTIDWP